MSKNALYNSKGPYYQGGACIDNSSAVEPCLAIVTSHPSANNSNAEDCRSNVTSSSEAGGCYVGADLEDDDDCGTGSGGESMNGSQQMRRALIANEQYDESFSFETDDSSHSESPDRERFAEAAGFVGSSKLNNEPNDEMFVCRDSSDGGGEESPRLVNNAFGSSRNKQADHRTQSGMAKLQRGSNSVATNTSGVRRDVPDRWESSLGSNNSNASARTSTGNSASQSSGKVSVDAPQQFPFLAPFPSNSSTVQTKFANNRRPVDNLAGYNVPPSERELFSSITITPPPDSSSTGVTDATNRHSLGVSTTSSMKPGVSVNGNYPRQSTLSNYAADNTKLHGTVTNQRSSQSSYTSSGIESPPTSGGELSSNIQHPHPYVPSMAANRHEGYDVVGGPRSGSNAVSRGGYDQHSPGDRSPQRSASPTYGPQRQEATSRRRRKKVPATRDAETIKSDQVADYQGFKDIDELLRFIDPKAAKKEKQNRKTKSKGKKSSNPDAANVDNEENEDASSITNEKPYGMTNSVSSSSISATATSGDPTAGDDTHSQNGQSKQDTQSINSNGELSTVSPPMSSEELALMIAASNSNEDYIIPSPPAEPAVEDFTPVDNKKRNKKSESKTSRSTATVPSRRPASGNASLHQANMASQQSSDTSSYLLTSGSTGKSSQHHPTSRQVASQSAESSDRVQLTHAANSNCVATTSANKEEQVKTNVSPAVNGNSNHANSWWNTTRDSGVVVTSPANTSRESAASSSSASSTSSGCGGRSRPTSDIVVAACDHSPVFTAGTVVSSASSNATTTAPMATAVASAGVNNTAQYNKVISNAPSSTQSPSVSSSLKPHQSLSAPPSKKTMPLQFGFEEPASTQPSTDAVVFMDGKDNKADVVKRFGISFASLEKDSRVPKRSQGNNAASSLVASSTPSTSLSFGTLDAKMLNGGPSSATNKTTTSRNSSNKSFAEAASSQTGGNNHDSVIMPSAPEPVSASRRSSSTSSSTAMAYGSKALRDDLLDFLSRRWRAIEAAKMSTDERLRPVELQC